MKADHSSPSEQRAIEIVLARYDREIARISASLALLKQSRENLANLPASPKPDEEAADQPAPESSKRTKGTSGQGSQRARLDHAKIAEEVALSLAPEFTSHDFLDKCLDRFPQHHNEFTLQKVKKRLRRMAGFDDAVITLIAKGGGRRPPRFKVNKRT